MESSLLLDYSLDIAAGFGDRAEDFGFRLISWAAGFLAEDLAYSS